MKEKLIMKEKDLNFMKRFIDEAIIKGNLDLAGKIPYFKENPEIFKENPEIFFVKITKYLEYKGITDLANLLCNNFVDNHKTIEILINVILLLKTTNILNLSNNALGLSINIYDSYNYIKMFEYMTSIIKLDISNNHLSVEQLRKIISNLPKNIKILNISQNIIVNLDNINILRLFKSLKKSALEYVDCSNNTLNNLISTIFEETNFSIIFNFAKNNSFEENEVIRLKNKLDNIITITNIKSEIEIFIKIKEINFKTTFIINNIKIIKKFKEIYKNKQWQKIKESLKTYFITFFIKKITQNNKFHLNLSGNDLFHEINCKQIDYILESSNNINYDNNGESDYIRAFLPMLTLIKKNILSRDMVFKICSYLLPKINKENYHYYIENSILRSFKKNSSIYIKKFLCNHKNSNLKLIEFQIKWLIQRLLNTEEKKKVVYKFMQIS